MLGCSRVPGAQEEERGVGDEVGEERKPDNCLNMYVLRVCSILLIWDLMNFKLSIMESSKHM